MSIERKVDVITGASQGIGAGLVRGFLERGYHCRELAVHQSRCFGGRTRGRRRHHRPAIADRVISSAVEKFGRVDTLINNPGIFIAKPFTEYSEADFANVRSVNLAGFFHVSSKPCSRCSRSAADTS